MALEIHNQAMVAEEIRPEDRTVHGGEEKWPLKPLGVKPEEKGPGPPGRNTPAIGGSETEV